MLDRIIGEAGRAAARIAAHLAHPVIVAYRELPADSRPGIEQHPSAVDPRSTVGGQFERAGEDLPMFGFAQRRASDAAKD